jgi:hypothetical protein
VIVEVVVVVVVEEEEEDPRLFLTITRMHWDRSFCTAVILMLAEFS